MAQTIQETAEQALVGSHTADTYHAKDAIGQTIKATLIVGSGGLFLSAVQNTLAKENVGPWGVLTRTGGTVWTFGACERKKKKKEFKEEW